jgi:UDP-2,4-diacetamido-2,4,6-trideoxy-beta-L-altropyranose hydrolase
MMNVFIRTDSSHYIGTGHVMRCLTLGTELKNSGHNVTFISRNLPGNIINLIEEQGFFVNILSSPNNMEIGLKMTDHSNWLGVSWQEDADETVQYLSSIENRIDLLIIDHYSIDDKWEKQVRNYAEVLMVIDDTADRKHDADILLDQNYYLNINERYQGKVPEHCVLLLGPKFSLLRDEFINSRNLKRSFSKVSDVFVFFGGTDPTNETSKTIEAIEKLDFTHITFHIVLGNSNPNKDNIKLKCDQFDNVRFYCQINNMAELMSRSQLAISAGGSTTWERYCLGLPAITIAVANNQIEIAETNAKLGIDSYLGESKYIKSEMIIDAIEQLIISTESLENSSKKAMNLVDGLGKKRVINQIVNSIRKGE